jgi:hypothetical protein
MFVGMHFSENFLYFIWQFRLFNTNELYCVGGEKLQVLNPGVLNTHAGPDFNQAKLIIDETTWAGNVEIHTKSSDWILHGHEKDKSYESVILHVVYEQDMPVYRMNGGVIPVLVLKGVFKEELLLNYNALMMSLNKFPCAKQIGQVDKICIEGMMSRLIVERFEEKSGAVLEKLGKLKGDWDETFYGFMASNFGFKVNAIPFELLADSLPQHILAKNKDNNIAIEALIFGQAGFLEEELEDEYPSRLKNEYGFLKKKYGLKPNDKSLWKFLRMRPQSFPTIRLAQFSGLIIKSNHLLSKVLEVDNLRQLYQLFEDLPVNNYWLTHFHFNKSTKEVSVQVGRKSIQNILINTVCVFLFAYGKYTDQPQFLDRALDFLDLIPAEDNIIIEQYSDSGIKAHNAFMSQALLQLNKYYCTQKKCLNCGIGIKILKK